MGSEDRKQSPRDQTKNPQTESVNGFIFSPRFKSIAAMAGWDEESLLCASLIVDDTPDRDSRHRKRTESQLKTPPGSNSRRKRRVQQRSPISVPMVPLDIDDGETTKKEATPVKEERKEKGGDILTEQNSGVSSWPNTSLPCMEKLREELSCAICLDICFEPSTTPCGHSFCLKCLRSAASKCGKKCPKCRQLISNGRSCTVNTVLWNTIQLLFPKEVEAKKSAGASKSRESEHNQQIPEMAFYDSLRNAGGTQGSQVPSRVETVRRRRVTQSQNEDSILSSEREMRRIMRAASRASSRDSMSIPSQDEDAALALRLQREEFLGSVRGTTMVLNQSRSSNSTSSTTSNSSRRTRVNQSSTSSTGGGSSSLSSARANLRAMASRAITLGARGRYNI